MLDRDVLGEEALKDIASVGGGYGIRIEMCMKELERLERAINYLKLRIQRAKSTPLLSMRLLVSFRKRFRETKTLALEYRKYLIIYREAIGLRKHREVYEVYNLERFSI